MLQTYQANIPQPRLDALYHRVDAFDWSAVPELVEHGDPWAAGTSLPFMRELCRHWTGGFDWRAQEAALNRIPQFVATIDGQDLHLLHARGSGAHDTALVLTHGWPGSVLEFLPVIERLAHPERFGGDAADGIDVVVPALPGFGFGFSGAPAAPIGPRAIAALWDRLLTEALGYRRYIAQGGDWGAMVSAMLGLHHAAPRGGCVAIHLNYLGTRAAGPATPEAQAFDARCAPFLADGRAYADLHRTRPQSFAYAMADNPVAQAAWIVEKFHDWSDLRPTGDLLRVHSADALLANIMLYAATGRFVTATWIYRAVQAETVRLLPEGTRITVPTGFLSLPCEIRPRPPRGLLEQTYDIIRFTEHDHGGHFAAMEQPEIFATDVAGFVRQVLG